MLAHRRSARVLGIAALVAAIFVPASSHAHFVLTAPAASTQQNALGDPQKAPPCGDDGSAVPTDMVTAYEAGDVITVTIDETIYHPGHYRIALALNDPSELPEPPPVTPNNTPCGTAPIQDPAVFPVLADGVWVHDAPFDAPQTIDIPVPDGVDCDNCTLQIIQFMSNHGLNNPGGCYYHHCATISVHSGAPSTTSGNETSSTGDETATTATTATTGSATNTTSGPDPTTGGTTGGDSASGDTTPGGTDVGSSTANGTSDGSASSAGSTSGASTDDDGGGCGCASTGEDGGLALIGGVLGLLGLRRRRRTS